MQSKQVIILVLAIVVLGAVMYFTVSKHPASHPSVLPAAPSTVAAPVAAAGAPAAKTVGATAPATPLTPTTASAATSTAVTAIPAAGLQLWLKADAGVSKDAGNAVSGWADQSGNKMDATSPSFSARPRYVAAAVHGKPAMRFDGTHSYFTLPAGFAKFAGVSIFVVGKPTAAKKYARFIELANKGSLNQFGLARALTTQGLNYGVHETNWGAITAPNALTPNAWQLLEAEENPQGNATIYTNGSAMASGKTDVPTDTIRKSNFIGWSNGMALGDEAYQGDIAEVIVYNIDLSQTSRQQVEQYLATKYALDMTPRHVAPPATPSPATASPAPAKKLSHNTAG